MNRIRCFMLLCLALVWVHSAAGQTPYKLPPKDVVAILDAPPPPLGIVSPTRDTLLLIEIQPYPSIEVVAEPILRLAGLQDQSANRRLAATGSLHRPEHPAARRLSRAPRRAAAGSVDPSAEWSYDGKKIAFARDVDDGVELWVADAATGQVEADRRRTAQRRARQTRSPGSPTIATSWLSSCPRAEARRQPRRGPRPAPTCRKAPGT